jgi:hypothetical protein
MATTVQFRRGTDAQNSVFTGQEGELTVNLTNKSLHVHDGTTAGGAELARADMANVTEANLTGLLNITGQFNLEDIRIDQNKISTVNSNVPLLLDSSGTGGITILSDTTVDSGADFFDIASHDGTAKGLKLAGTLVEATAADLNFLRGGLLDQDDMNSNDDTRGSTQQSIKAYVDNAGAITNTTFVSLNGDDANDGTSPNKAFRTIKAALSAVGSGTTILVGPGTFEEVFPLDIPADVTVKGASLRGTIIKPTALSRDNNGFRMNNGSGVEEITIRDQEYNNVDDEGYAFVFAPNANISDRSPYVKDVSVLSFGSSVRLGTNNPITNPGGFNDGDAGRGMKLDGSVLSTASNGSPRSSMLLNEVTFICYGADTIKMTSGTQSEMLNTFVYYANKAVVGETSATPRAGTNYGRTRIKLSGYNGTPFVPGETVTLTKLDTVTTTTFTVKAFDATNQILDALGRVDDLELDDGNDGQVLSAPSGAGATGIDEIDQKDYGAEIRMISSAFVYGNYGAVADGYGVQMKLIAHNFAYIGSGGSSDNLDAQAIQANEVTRSNVASTFGNGQIFYNSVDHKGDFRVGDIFSVEQSTGQVALDASQFNLSNLASLQFAGGGANVTLFSTDPDMTNNSNTSVPTEQAVRTFVELRAGSKARNYFQSWFGTMG